MAMKLGWFAIADGQLAPDRLRSELREISGVVGAERTPEWAFSAASGGWTTVILSSDGIGFVNEWALQASSRLRTATLSFWVFEGQWSWKLFERGTLVSSMDSHGGDRPVLSGDLSAASGLLHLSEEVIRRYAVVDGEDAFRAHPKDALPPWDEWAHVNFARHAGIEYPPVDEDERFFFREEDVPRFKKGKRSKPSFEPGSFAVFDVFGVVEIRARDSDGTIRYVAPLVDAALRYGDPNDPRWRQVVSRAEAIDLLRVVKEPCKQLKERRDRRRQTDDAIASGNPIALATALNELLEAKRQGSLRDPYEHTQLDSLRARLARELAVATNRSEDELHAELS